MLVHRLSLGRVIGLGIGAFPLVVSVGCEPRLNGAEHPVPKSAPTSELASLIDAEDAAKIAVAVGESWSRVCKTVKTGDRSVLAEQEQKCASGGLEECMSLGRARMCGAGVDKDESAAIPFFEKACRAKDFGGCHLQANALLSGQRDVVGGLGILAAACEQGSVHLCSVLGLILSDLKKAKSTPRAMDYLEKACSGGETDACYFLSSYVLSKDRTERERGSAGAKRGCDAGDAPACVMLSASQILPKDGVNPREGVDVAIRACEEGIAPGCGLAGFAYHFGSGVPRDDEKAIPFLRKACDLGFPSSCALLAKLTNGPVPTPKRPSSPPPPGS